MTLLDTRLPRRAAPARITAVEPRPRGQAWTAESTTAVFDAFMAATPMFTLVKDSAGRYLYANRQLLEQFGDHMGSDWFGKTDTDIWPADIAALSRASDAAALATDAPVQTTQLLPIGDTHVPFLVTKFPIHTLQGVHLGGIGLDISQDRALALVAVRHADQRALIADTLAHLPALATSEATAQMICRQVASLPGIVAAVIMRFAHNDRAWPMGLALTSGGSPELRRIPHRRSQYLHERAAQGAWIEDWVRRPWHPYDKTLHDVGMRSQAYAPIHHAGTLAALSPAHRRGDRERRLPSGLPADRGPQARSDHRLRGPNPVRGRRRSRRTVRRGGSCRPRSRPRGCDASRRHRGSRFPQAGHVPQPERLPGAHAGGEDPSFAHQGSPAPRGPRDHRAQRDRRLFWVPWRHGCPPAVGVSRGRRCRGGLCQLPSHSRTPADLREARSVAHLGDRRRPGEESPRGGYAAVRTLHRMSTDRRGRGDGRGARHTPQAWHSAGPGLPARSTGPLARLTPATPARRGALRGDHLVAASPFGHEESGVCPAEQRLLRGYRGINDGAPGAHGGMQRLSLAAGHRARLEIPTDFVGQAGGLREAAVFEDRDELLAPVARDEVSGTQALPQDLTENAEHGVASQMSVETVEVAEMIEIKHDRGQVSGPSEALEASDGEVACGVEMPTVVEAGQHIVDRERRHLFDEVGVRERERRARAEHGEHLALDLGERREAAGSAHGDHTQHRVLVDERHPHRPDRFVLHVVPQRRVRLGARMGFSKDHGALADRASSRTLTRFDDRTDGALSKPANRAHAVSPIAAIQYGDNHRVRGNDTTHGLSQCCDQTLRFSDRVEGGRELRESREHAHPMAQLLRRNRELGRSVDDATLDLAE